MAARKCVNVNRKLDKEVMTEYWLLHVKITSHSMLNAYGIITIANTTKQQSAIASNLVNIMSFDFLPFLRSSFLPFLRLGCFLSLSLFFRFVASGNFQELAVGNYKLYLKLARCTLANQTKPLCYMYIAWRLCMLSLSLSLCVHILWKCCADFSTKYNRHTRTRLCILLHLTFFLVFNIIPGNLNSK